MTRQGAQLLPAQPSAHGVLAGPLPGGVLVPAAVGLVDVGDLGHQRVIGVGVCQQGADGQQHLQHRRSENVGTSEASSPHP